MNEIVEQFRQLGMQASFHYADDSTKEWGQGNSAKDKALQLFDENPELQDEMREVAAKFLWSLRSERPYDHPLIKNVTWHPDDCDCPECYAKARIEEEG